MKYERLKENLNVMCMHNHTQGARGRVVVLTNGRKTENQVIDEVVSDCREILDKIENGTLIELPCKVGDTIYVPWVYDGEYGVSFHEIKRIEIYKGGIDILFDVDEGNFDIDALYAVLYIYNAGRFNLSLLGERFFITREEAEKRLKELQNG